MLRSHLTRTRLGLVLAVVAGVVLGAVIGQPGGGRAATAAVPRNTKAPIIQGSAVVGQTLTTTKGSWTNSPTSFTYAWSQCDATGAACLFITGATHRSYTVAAGDLGHTLRVTVTARNATGVTPTPATSANTAVVAPTGCPPGTGAIPVTQVAPPAQLVIAGASVTPAVNRSTTAISLHFAITACNGRAVTGATVYATPIPFNQFAAEQGTTDANGHVTLTERRLSGFPAAQHQRLLAVFARAAKPGDPVLGGVSARRVVAFKFSH
jgi:hypothetical protein